MKELLIDLRKHHDNPSEVASALIENKRTEKIEERVNPYSLMFDENGRPEFNFENNTELGMAEYQGMRNIWRLAKAGYKYVFWLSPEGGRSEYEDGRIVVGTVVDAGKKVEVFCRGIPILVKSDEMLEMAKRIKDVGGFSFEKVENAENLREQSLGLNLDNEIELWQFCESVFGMSGVWKTIIEGKDIHEKEKVVKLSEGILADIKVRFGSNFDDDNRIVAGAYLEQTAKIRGYEIVGGNHGGLNSDMLRTGFDSLFSKSKISVKAEVKSGKSYCPCGAELKDGSSVCTKCGLKISGSSS